MIMDKKAKESIKTLFTTSLLVIAILSLLLISIALDNYIGPPNFHSQQALNTQRELIAYEQARESGVPSIFIPEATALNFINILIFSNET